MSPSHNYIVSTGQHVSMSSCHHIMSPYHVTMSSSPTYHHVNVGILHLQFNEHQPNFLPLSLTMKAKASNNYYSGVNICICQWGGEAKLVWCWLGGRMCAPVPIVTLAVCLVSLVVHLEWDWGPTPSPLKATTLPSKGYHQALLHHLALPLAREDELLHQQAVKHPKTCPSAMPPFGPLLVSLCAIWVPAGVGCVRLTTQL